ncbi:MAG: epimerase, partial [Vulcanimicrobiaceae bacterium]
MLQRGWQVVAMVRNPDGASKAWNGSVAPHWLAGDAMVRDDVIKAAKGAMVIVHGVNPPGYRHWDRLVLPMIDNTIMAARAAEGARILLPGTIYNYNPVSTPVIYEVTPQR